MRIPGMMRISEGVVNSQITDAAALKMQSNSRWSLSLAIANGGALVAIAGHLLSKEATENSVALIFPSAWMFVVGLISAGLLPFLALKRAERVHLHWTSYKLITETIGIPPPEDRLIEKNSRLITAMENFLEWAAALSFIAGLVYPLVLMSMKYISTGHFLG